MVSFFKLKKTTFRSVFANNSVFNLHFMKTENDNNFGYEKISILVDNMPLRVIWYIYFLSICYCDHYMSSLNSVCSFHSGHCNGQMNRTVWNRKYFYSRWKKTMLLLLLQWPSLLHHYFNHAPCL
jgi:hypothetical protein